MLFSSLWNVQKLDFPYYIKVLGSCCFAFVLCLLQFLHVLSSCSLIVTNFLFHNSVVTAYVVLYLQGSLYHGTIYVISWVPDML